MIRHSLSQIYLVICYSFVAFGGLFLFPQLFHSIAMSAAFFVISERLSKQFPANPDLRLGPTPKRSGPETKNDESKRDSTDGFADAHGSSVRPESREKLNESGSK